MEKSFFDFLLFCASLYCCYIVQKRGLINHNYASVNLIFFLILLNLL
jgi:hypothetical protein